MPTENRAVPTDTERVRVFLRGGMVAEGDAHRRRGSYQGRISDVLNMDQMRFVPLTDVIYRGPGIEPMRTDAMLVRIEDIVAMDAAVAATAGAATSDVETPAPPPAHRRRSSQPGFVLGQAPPVPVLR